MKSSFLLIGAISLVVFANAFARDDKSGVEGKAQSTTALPSGEASGATSIVGPAMQPPTATITNKPESTGIVGPAQSTEQFKGAAGAREQLRNTEIPRQWPRMHNTLFTTHGRKLLAHDTGQGYKAYLVTDSERSTMPDGLYSIRGGGKLKVKAGWIIWSNETINRRYYNPAYDRANGYAGVKPALG